VESFSALDWAGFRSSGKGWAKTCYRFGKGLFKSGMDITSLIG
jgi:hypothetical protein